MSILIQIDIVDYDNLSSLGMRITKYVNSNLRDILRVLIDILETDPEFDLDGFFPRDYLMRKPQECRNAVNELYEIICSKNIRDFIKPKYEYLLYAILCWWEDCTDDEDDLIINSIDDELKRDLDNDGGKNILKWIQDYEEYYYICFQDHDFLPEQLSSMVMLYLRNPKLLEMFFQHDNLDDYIDLMECDLRDRYLEIQSKKNRDLWTSLSENVVIELISVIKRFQKRIVHFENRDEVEITADIQDAIAGSLNNKYGLHILVLCQDLVQVKMSFSHSNLPAIPKLPVDTIFQNHRGTYNRNDYEFVWYYKTFPSIQIPGGMHVCNC